MNSPKTSLSRIERSWIRSFFTLPQSLRNLPNSLTFQRRASPWVPNLENAAHISIKGNRYYIIWLELPESLINKPIDLSFRDFSFYNEPPVVLIREAISL